MSPVKQNTDTAFACKYCSNVYAYKGSLNTHVKNKHKEKTQYEMTQSIVEDLINVVMTRDIPKTKFTLTHEDLDQMLGDVAESLEAQVNLERDSCEICGKSL